ncbi:MAG: hypothetical protein JWM04_970, partial [Verrucomicrobiales bacterium]|nr:hypothetical protein [Verrucomicrobiales bacterium]
MRINLGKGAPVLLGFAVAATLAFCSVAPAEGQVLTNSWTNLTSGFWDSPNWSVSIPSARQVLYITNAGNKTITLDRLTALNTPESLSITALNLSGSLSNTNRVVISTPTPTNVFSISKTLKIGQGGELAIDTGSLLLKSTNTTATTSTIDGVLTSQNGNLTFGGTGGDSLTVGSTGSGLLSFHGQLSAGAVQLGVNSGAKGNIIQDSGATPTSQLFSLVLGVNSGSTGSYSLATGSLAVSGTTTVGLLGEGLFSAGPGADLFSSQLLVGQNRGAHGVFSMNGATNRTINLVSVGNRGVGEINQNGGLFSGGVVQIGNGAGALGAMGSYNLQGGSFSTTDLEIGLGGVGKFLGNGGTVTATKAVIGTAAGDGTLDLTGV